MRDTIGAGDAFTAALTLGLLASLAGLWVFSGITEDVVHHDPLSRFDIVFVPRSTVGNVEVFTRQVFGSANVIVNTMLTGWELFNVEKIYGSAVRNRNQ